ncbi:MAG: hypothetical protein ABJB86_16370 [Bacteroidota bacterium]
MNQGGATSVVTLPVVPVTPYTPGMVMYSFPASSVQIRCGNWPDYLDNHSSKRSKDLRTDIAGGCPIQFYMGTAADQ